MTTGQEHEKQAERTAGKSEAEPDSQPPARAATDRDAQETPPISGTIAAPPDNARQLQREIERTREQLGETVQELVARVDVKSRATAKATEVSAKYKNTVVQLRRAVTKGAGGRERWVLLAVAGAVIIDCLAIWQWKASSPSTT